MSLALRVLLVIVSLITFIFVLRKVRKSQIQLDDSLFWIIFAFLVLVASLFPQIFTSMAEMLGIESAANLVFLFFIFVLLIKSFALSIRVSQSDARIRELVQQLGIERLERHRAGDDRNNRN